MRDLAETKKIRGYYKKNNNYKPKDALTQKK